jgi:hypothetical protein
MPCVCVLMQLSEKGIERRVVDEGVYIQDLFIV